MISVINFKVEPSKVSQGDQMCSFNFDAKIDNLSNNNVSITIVLEDTSPLFFKNAEGNLTKQKVFILEFTTSYKAYKINESVIHNGIDGPNQYIAQINMNSSDKSKSNDYDTSYIHYSDIN